MNIYEKVTNIVIAQMEKGVVPWKQSWKFGNYPKNLLTKHRYHGFNLFLLYAQGYDSPYWLTFNQCHKMGGTIKKGEKSTPVTFWQIDEVMVDKYEDKKEKHIESRTVPILRYYNVFNVEQCEGLKIPEDEERKVDEIKEAKDIIKGYKDRPKVEATTKPYYSPSRDIIGMPLQKEFNSDEEYYSTMFHEMTHSTGHGSRLNRKEVVETDFFGSNTYSKEELVAEMGSAFLCAMTGISNKVIKSQASYVKNWLDQLKNDKRLLITAAGRANKAVRYIRGELKHD